MVHLGWITDTEGVEATLTLGIERQVVKVGHPNVNLELLRDMYESHFGWIGRLMLGKTNVSVYVLFSYKRDPI